VDGVSKFTFRAKEPETWYRVELPAETEEQREKAEEFKTTLQKVSYYERTPCPFTRAFIVDLPEEAADVKAKKRRRSTGLGRAKKWKLDQAYGWKPEDWHPGMDVPDVPGDGPGEGDASRSGSSDESETSSGPDEVDESAGRAADMNVSPLSARSRAMQALRSVSAKEHSSNDQRTTTARASRPSVGADGIGGESSSSAIKETTLQVIPTVMPPSPPGSSSGPEDSESPLPRASTVLIDTQDDVPNLQSVARSRKLSEEDARGGAAKPISDRVHMHESTSSEDESSGEDPPELANLDVQDEPSDAVDEMPASLSERPEGTSNLASDVDDREDEEQVAEYLKETFDIREVKAEAHAQDIAPPQQTTVSFNEHDQVIAPETHLSDNSAAQTSTEISEGERRVSSDDEDSASSLKKPSRQVSSEDPYAAIQARIMARRSLSGTTSFHPLHKSPTRSSTSSTSSSATLISSRAAQTTRGRQRSGELSSTLVSRAYSTFLGPPAHIVALMLHVAAKFANRAFGVNSPFYVESPLDSPRKVPGSFSRSAGDHIEEVDVVLGSDEEDDFGVPLHQPVSNFAELYARERRARRGDVD